MAKSMSVVVPPKAAAMVPVSKSSELVVPPKGMSRCVCTSMPPGCGVRANAKGLRVSRRRPTSQDADLQRVARAGFSCVVAAEANGAAEGQGRWPRIAPPDQFVRRHGEVRAAQGRGEHVRLVHLDGLGKVRNARFAV